MSEAIKPTPNTNFYNTLIPSLTDDANIQEALRMYHFGTEDGSIPDDSGNPVGSESIVSYLRNLQSQITSFEIGSTYAPTGPTGPANGYVWMKSDSTASVLPGTVAAYQNSAPTTGLVSGLLWVDKDSSPLKMYVYDTSGTPGWREIGA